MTKVITGGQLADVELYRPPGSPVEYGPILVEGGISNWQDFLTKRSSGVDPLMVWATQPSVRKVVDFIARAIASTPLKVYERVSDTDRPRITDHPLVRLLAAPAVGMTPYRFWYALIVDWLLFDRWCALKASTTDPLRGNLDLIRVQAARVAFADDGLGRVAGVWVDGKTRLDPAACLLDVGYSPLGANGTSPMQTLGAILQEASEAVAYRRAIWQRGARIPVVLNRPAGAKWDPTAKERFLAGWRRYASGGGGEGGTPILEDGMTVQKIEAFTPRDSQDIQGRQLNDAEVASAFQIPPELVGAREGTYSNVDAFRQMKYRDSLGPLYVAWEQVLNASLTPDLDPTGTIYVEADLDSKLRGSFDEQSEILSMSVGGPWLTRNEARARQNLPALGEGDALIVPLNVTEGGQASPRDGKTRRLTPVHMAGPARPAPEET